MLVLIGYGVALGCIFGAYIMHGGNMGVIIHALPTELMAILGGALGAFAVNNQPKILKATLAALPSEVCTHPRAHDDLSVFAGREVAIVGAGQSALESAALLHESGALVTVLARAAQLVWNGEPLAARRSIRQRLREPEATRRP